MKERPEEDDIIGSRPVPRVMDFGLFAGEPTDREPAPAPADPTGPPTVSAVSTRKRRHSDLLHEVSQTKVRTLSVVAKAIAGSGGLTRKEIADVTGLPVNTVNGRVSELLDPAYNGGTVSWAVCGGRRGNESVVWKRGEEPPEVEVEAKPIRHRYEGIVTRYEADIRPAGVSTRTVTLVFPLDAAPDVTLGDLLTVALGGLPASTALHEPVPQAHPPDPDAKTP